MLEKTLESPLDCKETKPVNPKGNNPECSLEGLMLKLQYFGHLMRRVNSLEKTLMLRKIEGKRRGWREIAGWHHQLNGHEFEQTLGDSEGYGSLACCSPWGHNESDMTQWLIRRQTCGWWWGMDWEFGISRCKLLYIEWINSKVLLCSTGNYIQYPVINHNRKEYEKEYIKTIYIHIYTYIIWITLLYTRN